MDKIADKTFDFNTAAKNICVTDPNYSILPEFERMSLLKSVIPYLKSLASISMTLTLN